MKRIYIFYNNNHAFLSSLYGVKTYINQLLNCLESSGYYYTLVNLCSDEKEITIHDKNGYEEIIIPIKKLHTQSFKDFFSAVPFILNEFIPDNSSDQLIFHLHSMEYYPLAQSLKKLYENSKIILTIHYTGWSFKLLGNLDELLRIMHGNIQLSEEMYKREIQTLLEKEYKLIKACDRLICIAEHTVDSIKKIHDIDQEKITLINNGLTDSFEKTELSAKNKLREKYFIGTETKVVLFVGRLNDVKGISHLLKSFRKTLGTYSNMHLFIAGKGDFEKWIEESSDFCSKVSFLGHLEKNKLSDFYRMANIGILPSLHEEFGYVAIEMMMNELPVIANNTTGLKEIVEHEYCGLKYNYSDENSAGIDELSDMILLYANNPEYAEKLGKNGRKRFLEKYSLPVFRKKMLDFYNKL